MKRRFIALLIPAISLLGSCNKNNLRSDIVNFIASFSVANAIENYPQGSYVREDISNQNGVTSKEITSLKMARSDNENLIYDYSKITYENEVEKSTAHKYIEKVDDKYFYHDGEQSYEKSAESIKTLALEFFYTSATEGIYTGGMFMGDAFREILPDIQDHVTIDSENKLLVYSYVNVMREDNNEVTITQTMSVDQWGMLVKDDLIKDSNLGHFETHILVKNSV